MLNGMVEAEGAVDDLAVFAVNLIICLKRYQDDEEQKTIQDELDRIWNNMGGLDKQDESIHTDKTNEEEANE